MRPPRRVPVRVMALGFAFAWSGELPLHAQDPVPQPPAPQPVPTPTPTPTPGQQGQQGPLPSAPPQAVPPKPAPPVPIDPTRAAADLLRRRLGLQPGPQGEPPPGPVVPPPEPPAGDPAAPPGEQGATPGTRVVDPSAGAAQDPPPKPAPPVPTPPPQDPVQQAADALRRLLPKAKPPEVAPIPDAHGTPEPFRSGPPDPSGPTAAATTAAAAAPTVPFSGSFGLRYRARHGDGATDQDVVGRLQADLGAAERDAWTAHLSARGFWDADGRRRDDPFVGLDQSLGDEWNGRLYRAHVDVHRQGLVELARLGRQDLDETPTPLTFDGARLDSQRLLGPTKAWFSAYGGVPVHHFEASRHGDSVVGAAAGLQPWLGARVRVDAMQLRDEFLALDRRDDLLGLRWWQGLGPLHLHGLHTWRDGQPRDLVVGARGEAGTWCSFDVDYRELLSTQRQQVSELDPFYTVAFEYAPYRQVDVTLRRDFGEHLSLGLGSDVRRLRDDADETDFNREFERHHVDANVDDVVWRGLSLSLAGSMWRSSGEDFRAVTGELAWRPHHDLRVALGSGYDLFLYDLFDGRERVHVRSYYVRGEHRLAAALRVDGGYELQRDDTDEFHVFRLGVTWTF